MRVGFIGLGVMGKPMTLNLLKAGHEVKAFTRTESVLQEVVDAGAERCSSPAEASRGVEAVITMLPNSPIVAEVLRGENGVFAGIEPGALIIDMSTIDPQVARELAEEAKSHGATMLDAPVSGGDVGAQQGILSIMVGGEEEAFQRAMPLFEAMGKTIVRVGESGAGQVVKACNQVVVGITFAAISEALVLGAKHGVSGDKVIDALSGGLAGSRVMEVRRNNFLNHDFTPGFRINLHHKDLNIALGAAAEKDVALPLTAVVQQMFQIARGHGKGDLDDSALLTVLEDWAGVEV